MCFYDLEAPEFFVQTFPVARKAHVCDERGCAIAKGGRYENVRAKWDLGVETLKVCSACQAIKAEIVRRELAAGCSRSEAHPGYVRGALGEVLANYDEEERESILKAAEAEAAR